ncbi:MAG: hypothetical protein IPK81_02800 [Rhodospirillales bacterium]|nr:hypothetical protein [Rhodospirillales bacterium]QQS13203.1 MAG: hypothetical protein IPK81_02800 [Rhodospirillales bacterium]
MAFELTSGEQLYLAMVVFAAIAFMAVTILCRLDYSRWRDARAHDSRPSGRATAAPAE